LQTEWTLQRLGMRNQIKLRVTHLLQHPVSEAISWTLTSTTSLSFEQLSLQTLPKEVPNKLQIPPTNSIAALVVERDYVKSNPPCM